jgi:uncharacterized membrane protein
MNSFAHANIPIGLRDRQIVAIGAVAGGAILLAFARGAAHGQLASLGHHGWLALHLASVIPALPLGGYLLLRRKGDRTHRLLGRVWGVLMLVAALSSFALQSAGHLSVIHLLSALVLVMVPRGVLQAIRHNVAGHRRTMSLTYLGLAVAGLFTLLPGRLLGSWLFG